jgi:hypothetical protein
MRFVEGEEQQGDLRYWCYPAASDGPGPRAQGELQPKAGRQLANRTA